MEYLSLEQLRNTFKGKKVAIVGSGPSAMDNEKLYIDSYDEVVRVNNYKTKGISISGKHYDYTDSVGYRVDYHYSFYGGSIRKTADELLADGVKAHLCKCPNDDCHVTEWHKERNQQQGGDFRPIYRRRHDFWVKPVYIPTKDHYMELFHKLGDHVPTTGFACIWEFAQMDLQELYITGFDFMKSGLHNMNEPWNPGKQDDPVKHLPDQEEIMVKKMWQKSKFIRLDRYLRDKYATT